MYDLQEYSKEIVRYTTKATGIPVSMGVAPTKTLAKVAVKFAKKYPGYENVCCIDSEEKRVKALRLTDIEDVWGIGRANAEKLRRAGIKTAFDFTQHPSSWVRKHFTVVSERTWRELQGISCISMDMVPADKKQICTSRAFGKLQSGIEVISEAVATYAALCAEKLRRQKSCAVSLCVFLQNRNGFRPGLSHYYDSYTVTLAVPSSSTFEIVKYALIALRKIWRENYQYRKAGVIITEIVPAEGVQTNLFDEVRNRDKQDKLMKVMDAINRGYNGQVLSLAIAGNRREWKMKQKYLSPCYTTEWDDIIRVICVEK